MSVHLSGSGEGSGDLHRAAMKRLCLQESDLVEQPFSEFLAKYKDQEKAHVFHQKHQGILQELAHRVAAEESKIVSNGLSQAEYAVLGSPPSLGKYLRREMTPSPVSFDLPRSQTHALIAKSLTNRQIIAQEEARRTADAKALLQQKLQMTSMKRDRLAEEAKEAARFVQEKHVEIVMEKSTDKRRYLEQRQREMEQKCQEQRMKHEAEVKQKRQELQKLYQEKMENAKHFAEIQEQQQKKKEMKRLEADKSNEQKRIEFQRKKEANTSAYEQKLRMAEAYRAQLDAERKRQEESLKEKARQQNEMQLRKQEVIQRQKTMETRQEYEEKMARLLEQQANVRRMQQEEMERKQQLKVKNKEQIEKNVLVKEQQAHEARRKAIEIQAALEEKKQHIKILQQKHSMDIEIKRQTLDMELANLQTRQQCQRQARDEFVSQNNKLALARSPDELAKMCQSYATRYGQ